MNKQVRLWLDDTRDPYSHGRGGWLWVKSFDTAVSALLGHEVIEASLDFNLSFDSSGSEPTGYDVVCWMEEHGVRPRDGIHVHSSDKYGARRMQRVINRLYGRDGLEE